MKKSKDPKEQDEIDPESEGGKSLYAKGLEKARKNAVRSARMRRKISLSDEQITNRVITSLEAAGVTLVSLGDMRKHIDLEHMNPEEFDIEGAIESVYANDTLPKEIVHLVSSLAMDLERAREVVEKHVTGTT